MRLALLTSTGAVLLSLISVVHAQGSSSTPSVTPGPPIWISTGGPESDSSTPTTGGGGTSTRETTTLPSGGPSSGIVTIQTSTNLPSSTQTFIDPSPSSGNGTSGGVPTNTTQVGQPSGTAPPAGNGTDTSAGTNVGVAFGSVVAGAVAVLWANIG